MLKKQRGWIIIIVFFLVACEQRQALAPLQHLNFHLNHPMTYRVVKGDTLYSIAFRYDLDHHILAYWNHLSSPYKLYPGQILYLKSMHQVSHKTKISKSSHDIKKVSFIQTSSNNRSFPIASRQESWRWPLQGKIISNFSPHMGKKGIDIAGKRGDFVRAASNGVVAYAGSGLAGYGNLIIIKHHHYLLTAYGHNRRNRVQEGDVVRAGQIIADVGMVNRQFFGVHFEIRDKGMPINPLKYLRK